MPTLHPRCTHAVEKPPREISAKVICLRNPDHLNHLNQSLFFKGFSDRGFIGNLDHLNHSWQN